jgi:hypothetical protein
VLVDERAHAVAQIRDPRAQLEVHRPQSRSSLEPSSGAFERKRRED